MPMAAAPPTTTRSSLTAAAIEAEAASSRTARVCSFQKIMQLVRGRRLPCARDKRVRLDPGMDQALDWTGLTVRKFKGARFGTQDNKMCPERVYYITSYVYIRPSVRMMSQHSFGANARVCKARSGTQFWRQRERMQDARYGTEEADVVGWRGDQPTHMFAVLEFGISEPQ